MKKNTIVFYLFIVSILFSCDKKVKTENKETENKPNRSNEYIKLSPDVQYGKLFEAVQIAQVFPDSKTFPDGSPNIAPALILEKYEAAKADKGFDLKKFVAEHFAIPASPATGYKSNPEQTPEQHINALWGVLTHPADAPSNGTLLPLPKPYVVPGGRFGEIYYWDSYFTMLGLEAAGRKDLIGNMVENFAHLINAYGHVPNGNRSYYLSRSQPPFFSLMVRLLDNLYDKKEKSVAPLEKFLPELEKEYAFWMHGSETLTEDYTAERRVVRLDNGLLLNRYWDDLATPRPESYREDVQIARSNQERSPEDTYRNIRAGAESGWDFSSRWGAGRDLKEIQVLEILPIDLNCLLWHLEKTLSDGFLRKGDAAKTELYGKAAYIRERALRLYFYDKMSGYFMDFNWKSKNPTGVFATSGMFPLYFNIAKEEQAAACAKTLETKLLRPGGIVATNNVTGQQWDAPNGWAPMQWIAIEALRRNGQQKLAHEIKKRWIDLNVKVYQRTGKMLEKYNVENPEIEGGGGEYPLQDGFGWTNGVLLRLMTEKK